MKKTNRAFAAEFRARAAQRMLDGESVTKMQQELAIRRSVLYRWRDQYRREGAAGLERPTGGPPEVASPLAPKPGVSEEESLRRQIAELERKIGQQAVQLDFFKRVFKRIKEASQRNGNTGARHQATRHF